MGWLKHAETVSPSPRARSLEIQKHGINIRTRVAVIGIHSAARSIFKALVIRCFIFRRLDLSGELHGQSTAGTPDIVVPDTSDGVMVLLNLTP